MNTKTISFFKFLLSTLASLLGIFLIAQVLIAYAPKEINETAEGLPKGYKVFSIELPKHPILAGERVPIEYYDVKEALDREFHSNTYWQSNTILMMKRAHRFFPIIEPILKKHNVPDDFKYLMVIESGMMNVRSHAGAAGFWQFMKLTGKEYKLEINREVDERYHLEKATVAACKYLKEAHRKFKNWTLVAASYNRGRGGMRKALRHQQATDYWELFLNRETARYVSRIVALKYMMQKPESYGFYIKDADKYAPLPSYEVEVKKSVLDWAQWCKKKNVSYKLFRSMNPWVRDKKLTIKKKVYKVKLLKKGYRDPQRVNRDLLNSF